MNSINRFATQLTLTVLVSLGLLGWLHTSLIRAPKQLPSIPTSTSNKPLDCGGMETSSACLAPSTLAAADTLFMKANFKAAADYYEKALRENPANPSLLRRLANAYRNTGEWNRAKELYEKALVLEPNEPDLHYQFAKVLAHRRDWDESISHYRQCIALTPEMADAYTAMGQVLHEKHQALALQNLIEQSKAGELDAKGMILLGQRYFQMGRYADSTEQFLRFFLFKLLSEERLRRIGLVLADQSHWEKAVLQVQCILDSSPNHPQVLWATGCIALAKGDVVNAIGRFEKLRKIRPDNQTISLLHMYFQLLRGNIRQAVALYREQAMPEKSGNYAIKGS